MNWFASDTALSACSPSRPTMMVSIMFTPMVIMLCKAMGMAMAALFL